MLGARRSLPAALALFCLAGAGCGPAHEDLFGQGSGSGGGTTTTATATTTATTTSTATATATAPSCSGASDCVALVDACHTASCVQGACVQETTSDGTSCDDGLFCTDGDQCQAGACVGTTKTCPAGAACEIPTCDESAKACTLVPASDGATCNDGDPCTLAGACQGGVCMAGAPISCAQLDSTCTVGVCDPQKGCQAQATNEGGTCDDGLYCTVGDACVSGACQGSPRVCPQPADVCMVDACDEASQACDQVPGNDGTFCDDGNACTTGETCNAGMCGDGTPTSGGACDDGNACTVSDACNAGTCTGTPITACVSGDGCCPSGCEVQGDLDCIYWATGVQTNIPETQLMGWELCYSGTYDEGLQADLPTILQQCSRAHLLLACRPVGAADFDVLAMGDRADVLFDCGTQTSCTHEANGVGWYYSDDYSWGLAPAGQSVNRAPCDTNAGSDRLCWHTDGESGHTCGTNVALWNTWERVVYQAY